MKAIKKVLAIVCFVLAVIMVIMMLMDRQQWVVYLIIAAVFVAVALLLLRKKKPSTALETVQPAEQVDAYVDAGGVTYRTDGKPIEDREVPYLVQKGLQDVLERPAGAPEDATPEELAFLAALEDALKAAKKSPYYSVTRKSNKSLAVRSASYNYIGAIKLQGRKTWMQYPTRGGNFDSLEGATLEEYIALLPKWVKAA